MVRAYREASLLDIETKEKGCPHHRKALSLRRIVVALRRVKRAAPKGHGPRGLLGLFLQ